MRLLSVFLSLIILFGSCKEPAKHEEKPHYIGLETEDLPKLEDLLFLKDSIKTAIAAKVETDPVSADSSEDAADDPAIWYNAADPTNSLIYGSNKKGGIVTYDLSGKQLAYYPVGNVNNLDVLKSLYTAADMQILGASNRSFPQAVDLYIIDSKGELKADARTQVKMDSSIIDDVYGFCFAKDVAQQKDYFFVNGKNGNFQQYSLEWKSGTIEVALVRDFTYPDQPEGMVSDDEAGILYLGLENTGIYYETIDPKKESVGKFITDSGEGNPKIKYDIEGLSLAEVGDNKYLVASSQGNCSYAFFDVKNDHKYIGSFKISDSDDIDGTEDTDGIEVNTMAMGDSYPNGIFVAQDGFNFSGDTLKAQNFKIVDFSQVIEMLEL